MDTIKTLLHHLVVALGLAATLTATSGCLENEDTGEQAYLLSEAATKWYEKIKHMSCKAYGEAHNDGAEKACTGDGDCANGTCDQNCGCCVPKPPAAPTTLCRYVAVQCVPGGAQQESVRSGYYDTDGTWHDDNIVDVFDDPAGEPTEPDDGHTYGEPSVPGDSDHGEPVADNGAGCTCPALGAVPDGPGYFGPCLADASTYTTANCAYPPDGNGDPQCGNQFCVYEMKVTDTSGCCDPTKSSCNVPPSYGGSECGGKSCKGNAVAICNKNGTYTKKTDCTTLAVPSL